MSDLCDAVQKFGKGIGNTSRYRIVETLFTGRKSVNEITKLVGLTQPAISQHLKVLKASGIVIDERRGQEVLYSLDNKHVLTLLKHLVGNVKNKK